MALRGEAGCCWLFLISISWTIPHSHGQITFITSPSSITVARGIPVTFDCSFTSSRPVSVNWQRNGSVLPPSPPKYTYLINNSLVISPTEAGDEGAYSCVVTDQISLEPTSQTTTLTFAFILNSFVSEPESQTVDEGSLVFFFCIHAGSLPPASITWAINDDVIVTSSTRAVQTSVLSHTSPQQVSSSLVIASVQRSDVGRVVCTATNPLLPSIPIRSSEATLAITVQPFSPSITQQPVDVTTPGGGTASFSCAADGNPLPTFTWSQGSTRISPSTNAAITSSGSISTLALTNVRSTNAGLYQCTATNTQGTAVSNTAQLQIASLETAFMLEPADTVALIGQDTIIDCVAPASVPPAVITWSRDFSQLNSPRYQVQQNGSLVITGVVLSDQTTYYCTATNPLLGMSRLSRGALVTTIGEPTLTPSVATVPVGLSASFFCSAIGNPLPQITWYRGTVELTTSTPRVAITGSTLTISGIVIEDRGHYTCRAMFSLGTTEAEAFLNILIPPSFQVLTANVTAIPMQPITLPCSTFPDPTLSYSWSFDGTPLSPVTSGGSLELEQEGGGLIITDVRNSNEGTYTCTASNNLGSANGTVYLNVLTVPTITADSAVVIAVQGSIATLHCTASGEPPPTQTWMRDGVPVSGSQISTDGRVLTVSSVGVADGGVYTCHASNSAGTDSASVMLDVHLPPRVQATPTSLRLIAGSNANFTCTATGNPAPQLTWLTQNFTDVTTLGDSRFQVVSDVSGGGLTLLIRELQARDQQQYVCRAINTVAIATASVQLAVLVSPLASISTETVAVQGNPLTLDCQATGQPTPTVTWSRGSTPILPDSRLTVDEPGRLVFSTVFSTDAGDYRCTATNEIGSASANTMLQVLVVPVIQATTLSVTASDGSPALLNCLATGNPTPVVTWFFNSAQVPIQGDTRVQQTSNNSLTFTPVQTPDEGSYICRATNTAGTESATVQLTVHMGPIITATEVMVTAVTGMATTLRCTATGDPVPLQSWTRNGAAITDSRFQVLANGNALQISDVREDDQGVYQCHASNIVGINTATVNLTVISVPVIQAPVGRATSILGASAVLDCQASGDPPPIVNWFFRSNQLPNQGDSRVQQASNSSLLISPVQTSDRGEYLCFAMNLAGNDSITLNFTVYVVPVIRAVESSVTVVVGESVTMSCVASGDPTPTQTWSRNGVGVAGPRVQLSTDGSTLTLTTTTLQDEGTYTCHASNPAGTLIDTVTLNIIVPPTIIPLSNSTVLENTFHSITCSAMGDPAPSVTWMLEGRVLPADPEGVLVFTPVLRDNVGVYTCTATNTAGTVSALVYLEVQYLPEIVVLPANLSIPVGSSASFSCTVNSSPSADITWLFNSVVITGAQQPTYTVATVTGADTGTYTCVASNIVGIAHDSAILTPIFPPSAPILLSATATSSDIIALQWTAIVDDGGSPVISYLVEYRDSSSPSSSMFMSRSFGASILSADLDNLTPFVNYEVRIRADNIAGPSIPSNTMLARTHPEAPSSPTNFGVVSFTVSSFTVNWGIPDQLNGMFVMLYQFRYAQETSFASSLRERLLFSPQFTVEGVELGVVYRVEVRASTIGLSGETLFGPFAVLRVRDGVELEIPVTQP